MCEGNRPNQLKKKKKNERQRESEAWGSMIDSDRMKGQVEGQEEPRE